MIIIVALFIIIIVTTLTLSQGKKVKLSKICSDDSGLCYCVRGNHPYESVKRLDRVHELATNLILYMKTNYPDLPYTNRLERNYNVDALFENVPESLALTSYVENKGEKFAMCLQHKGEMHDMHLIEFVALHELAHLASGSYGHDHEFWITFRDLLIIAEESGLHVPIDYKKVPVKYCGLEVDYNPFHCPRMQELDNEQ